MYFFGSLPEETFGGSWLSRFSQAKTFHSPACLLSPLLLCSGPVSQQPSASPCSLEEPYPSRSLTCCMSSPCTFPPFHLLPRKAGSSRRTQVSRSLSRRRWSWSSGSTHHPVLPLCVCPCLVLHGPLSALGQDPGMYLSLRRPQGPAWDAAARVHLNSVGLATLLTPREGKVWL